MVHDHHHNNLPISFDNFFIQASEIHSINTRSANAGQLYVHSINTEMYGRNSTKYKSIQLWNNLTKHFPGIDLFDTNVDQLKNLISEYYLDSYLD